MWKVTGSNHNWTLVSSIYLVQTNSVYQLSAEINHLWGGQNEEVKLTLKKYCNADTVCTVHAKITKKEGAIKKQYLITITLTQTSGASIYETAKQTSHYEDRPALVLQSNFTSFDRNKSFWKHSGNFNVKDIFNGAFYTTGI